MFQPFASLLLCMSPPSRPPVADASGIALHFVILLLLPLFFYECRVIGVFTVLVCLFIPLLLCMLPSSPPAVAKRPKKYVVEFLSFCFICSVFFKRVACEWVSLLFSFSSYLAPLFYPQFTIDYFYIFYGVTCFGCIFCFCLVFLHLFHRKHKLSLTQKLTSKSPPQYDRIK